MSRLFVFTILCLASICTDGLAQDGAFEQFRKVEQTRIQFHPIRPVPVEVSAYLPAEGATRRFGRIALGPGSSDIWLHVYQSKKVQFLEVYEPANKLAANPAPAEEITPNNAGRNRINDVGETEATGAVAPPPLRRLHCIRLDEGHPSQPYFLSGLWLVPGEERAPIIVISHFKERYGAKLYCVFPQGISGQPYLHKLYLETAEAINPEYGDWWTATDHDRVDDKGALALRIETGGNRQHVEYYTWNGVEWMNGHRPFFVIAGAFKSHREAEAYVDRMSLVLHHQAYSRVDVNIQRSDYYPELGRGYFIVVIERCATKQEAADKAAEWRRRAIQWRQKPEYSELSNAQRRKFADKVGHLGDKCYVKRGF